MYLYLSWRGRAGLGNKDDVKHKKDDLVDLVLTSSRKTRVKNKFG